MILRQGTTFSTIPKQIYWRFFAMDTGDNVFWKVQSRTESKNMYVVSVICLSYDSEKESKSLSKLRQSDAKVFKILYLNCLRDLCVPIIVTNDSN